MERQFENSAPTGFLEPSLPLQIILASFFVFTVPLIWATFYAPDFLQKSHLAALYFVVIGATHFCLTFAFYLQTDNINYFNSTRFNRVIYFAVPLLIFGGFVMYRLFGIATKHPVIALAVVGAVRFFNFHHWGRQSFGMLQLYRRRAGCQFPPWLRHTENIYFYVLIGLMMLTFMAGGSVPKTYYVPLLIGLSLVLLAVNLYGFFIAHRQAQHPAKLLAPLSYLALQSAAGAFAIFSTGLYTFTLAMHYVEYHVVMYPRTFNTPLHKNKLDQAFGLVRSNKIIFYIILLLVAATATALIATSGKTWSLGATLVLSVFDGLFLFHYFVEAFVWKMGKPYYRNSTLPLYFSPRKKAEQAS